MDDLSIGTPRGGGGPGPASSPDRAAFSPSDECSYAIFVLGASGDLAHKKTYPSLYELFCKGLLPPSSVVMGYARSAMSDDAFRATIRGKLKGGSDEQREAFVGMCLYRNGGYDDAAAFARVAAEVAALEDGLTRNGVCGRVFYFAIPPSVFVTASATVHASGFVRRAARAAARGWRAQWGRGGARRRHAANNAASARATRPPAPGCGLPRPRAHPSPPVPARGPLCACNTPCPAPSADVARLEPRRGGEALRRGLGHLGAAVARPGPLLQRGAHLPHRPLPGQGDGAEPARAALRQRRL